MFLYTLVGSYGKALLVEDRRPFCIQRHIGILRSSTQLDPKFITRLLQSELVFSQATQCATGIAQKTVSLGGLRNILVPLPPLPEQRRIASMVNELFTVCDQLTAALTDGAEVRRSLCEALFREALATTASEHNEVRP